MIPSSRPLNVKPFSEPMRVETVRANSPNTRVAGLVSTQSERFREVTLTRRDLESLTILDARHTYDGDGRLLRLGPQAYALGIVYEFGQSFGLCIFRVDPLPHQLEVVYGDLLKLARGRFLLADDAGAAKTIMAGLLIRELELRGMAERILILCPASLSFQGQRELKEKFDAKFLVLKGGDIRDQFGVNQWLEQKKDHHVARPHQAARDPAGAAAGPLGLRHRGRSAPYVGRRRTHKSLRYTLGELLRSTSDHMLLLTATPHKDDPLNFSLFLQLLDADARFIRETMDRRRAPFYLRRTKEAMVYFPERRTDGTWVAEKIFTKRIPHTVEFQVDGAEFDLYWDITRFLQQQSTRAASGTLVAGLH